MRTMRQTVARLSEALAASERRHRPPYGLTGGQPGRRGRNVLVRADGTEHDLPGKATLDLEAGDTLSLIYRGDGKWYETGRSDNGK